MRKVNALAFNNNVNSIEETFKEILKSSSNMKLLLI